MLGLFIWVLIHFLLISQNKNVQHSELNRIWKYVSIGFIFALGFGFSLGGLRKDSIKFNAWTIVFVAIMLPTLIYVFKYFLNNQVVIEGLVIPNYLKTYKTEDIFYIPKSDYVAFVLPGFALALGCIKTLSKQELHQECGLSCKFIWLQYLIYSAAISSSLFVFYQQNIKNGMIYAAVLGIGLVSWLAISAIISKKNRQRNVIFCILTVSILSFAGHAHLKREDTWKTLAADISVATQIDKYQEWKFAGDKGYPNNQYGSRVQISTYERVAWLVAGASLALNHPLGYGLVEDSFKFLAQAHWPEVSPNLSHTHSGWLDLILAIGFPGFFFVIACIFTAMWRSIRILQPWRDMVFWCLLANLLLWCTTEVSSTIAFASLLFWINLATGITLMHDRK
jgi:O-antigen ligase